MWSHRNELNQKCGGTSRKTKEIQWHPTSLLLSTHLSSFSFFLGQAHFALLVTGVGAYQFLWSLGLSAIVPTIVSQNCADGILQEIQPICKTYVCHQHLVFGQIPRNVPEAFSTTSALGILLQIDLPMSKPPPTVRLKTHTLGVSFFTNIRGETKVDRQMPGTWWDPFVENRVS